MSGSVYVACGVLEKVESCDDSCVCVCVFINLFQVLEKSERKHSKRQKMDLKRL